MLYAAFGLPSRSLNKPIYVIKIEEIEKGSFRIRKMEDLWFKDPNYEQLAILSGKKIIL